jgi:hypothetical protein
VSRPAWQTVLLLLHPPLTLLYLVAVRGGWVAPSYVPVAILALAPLAVLLRGGRTRWRVMAAALELAWAILAAMSVGFAIAWQLC